MFNMSAAPRKKTTTNVSPRGEVLTGAKDKRGIQVGRFCVSIKYLLKLFRHTCTCVRCKCCEEGTSPRKQSHTRFEIASPTSWARNDMVIAIEMRVRRATPRR